MTLVINNVPSYVTRNDIAKFVERNTGYSVCSVKTMDSRTSQGALCVWITMMGDTQESTAASLLNGRYWGSHRIITGTTGVQSNFVNAKKSRSKSNETTQITLSHVLIGIALIVVFAIMIGVPVEIMLTIPLVGGAALLAISIGGE